MSVRTPGRTAESRRWPAAGLLALVGAACTPTQDVPNPAGADEVLLGAVLLFDRSDGVRLDRVLSSRRLASGDVLVAPTGADDQVLVTWRFSRSAFLRPTGEPLTDADFDAMTMRAVGQVSETGAGRCGRCLAPAFGALPQVVHAGSSCAPPRLPPPAKPEEDFVRFHTVTPDLDLSTLRDVTLDQIRFDWGGACACEITDVARPYTPISVEPVGGVTDTLAHRVVTESPDGVVGLFDDRDARLVARSGTVTVTTSVPSYVVAGVSLSDTEHLIGVVSGGVTFTHEWHRAGPDLGSWTVLGGLTQEQLEVHVARAVPERPGHFLVGGIRRNSTADAEVLLCATAPVLCVPIIRLGSFAPSEKFTQLYPVEDGAWVVMTDDGTLVHIESIPHVRDVAGQSVVTSRVQARPDGAGAVLDGLVQTGTVAVLRWRAMHIDVFVLPTGARLPAGDLKGSTVVGDRVYLCVLSPGPMPEDDRQLLVSRRFSRADLSVPDPLAELLGFEIASCRVSARSGCRALVTTGTVGRAILEFGRNTQMLRFDRDGPLDPVEVRTPACEEMVDAPLYDLGVDFAMHLQTRPDGWLGVTAGGDVASFEPGQPARWVYGSGQPRQSWTAVVPEDSPADGGDGGAWLFGPNQWVGYLAAGSTTAEVRPAPALRFGVREAAADHSVAAPDRGFLIIDHFGRVGRLTIAADRGPATLDMLTTSSTDAVTPTQVVEVAPGVHVAIAGGLRAMQERQVWRIRGRQIDKYQVPEDDPATEAGDLPYLEGGRCNLARRASEYPYISRSSAGLRAITASHGIAWVAGCGAELHRVTAVGEQVRIERFAYTRIPELLFPTNPPRPFDFTAATALCPDHVLLGGPETTTNVTGASVRLWEIRPSRTPEAVTRADADVRVVPLTNEPAQGVIDKGHLLAIVPGAGSPRVVLSGSQDNILGTITQMAGGKSLFFSNAPQSALRLPDGRLLVTLEGGPVLVGPD